MRSKTCGNMADLGSCIVKTWYHIVYIFCTMCILGCCSSAEFSEFRLRSAILHSVYQLIVNSSL
jgi:hypothetical protein